MRWLALFLLVGCGAYIDPAIPNNVMGHARACARQSFQKEALSEEFFNGITTRYMEETNCHTAGCYVGGEIEMIHYTDGSYNLNQQCLLLCHEYVHAIGDIRFGDPDSDHQRWDYYSSNPHCGELML